MTALTTKTQIALLRGINVGGYGVLPMARLRAIAEDIGFKNVRTFIQSGNLLFDSQLSEKAAGKKLAQGLAVSEKRDIPVIMRNATELRRVLALNPFPRVNPALVGVIFFTDPVPKNALKEVRAGIEELVISGREVYIHYPNGMGKSKLKLPKALQNGTTRNMNTVRKLVELCF